MSIKCGFDVESEQIFANVDECEAPHFVVLVHGTFASRASWVMASSQFCENLKDIFPEGRVLRYYWDGRNQFGSRRRAAIMLRRTIKRLLVTWPAGRVTIVAHSHGGAVAYYALNGMKDITRCSLACLSTPFIHVDTRPSLQQPRFFGGFLFLALFILVTALMLPEMLGSSFFERSTSEWLWIGATYLAIAIPCLIFVIVNWIGRSSSLADQFVRRYQRFSAHATPGLRFHLYRLPRDEASLVLYATQAIETSIVSLMARLDRLVGRAGDAPRGLINRIPNWLTMGCFWAAMLLTIFGLADALLWYVIALFAIPAISFAAPVLSFLARVMLGAAITILSFMGGVLYGFAYGFECMPLIILLSLSCEPGPEGPTSMTYLAVGTSIWSPTSAQLYHSSYEHPAIADTIASDLLLD